MKLSFTGRAEADLERIANYVALDDPRRAVALVTDFRKRCAAVCDFPYAAMVRPEILEDIRVIVHAPYLILYSVRDDTVVIERIVHGAQHPPGVLKAT